MSSQPPAIFISYARQDAAHKERLVVHLQGLIQQGVISAWHDGLLVPGQEWDKEIVKNLEASRLVVLLISPDFIASEYANRVELRHAAERRAEGQVCVVPVLVEHVYRWQDKPLGDTRLGALQALPDGGRFVAEWDDDNVAWTKVVAGIAQAVTECVKEGAGVRVEGEPGALPHERWSWGIPDPPAVGVVPRRDRKGRDIVGHLVEELAPGRRRRMMLSGPAGIGKKTLAAEAARRLLKDYGGRVVWSDAARRANYTEYSLFDDIVEKFDGPKPHKFPSARKRAEADVRIAGLPLLVVIDSYAEIEHEERHDIQHWLERSPCSALFVSREVDASLDLHNVSVVPMWPDEAREFFRRRVRETQSPQIFNDMVRDCVLHEADGNPLALKWIVEQIDRTRRPDGVLQELRRGKGAAANRIFNYTFKHQLGDDERAALLALSLFTPNAAHEPLARVAGFGRSPRALKRLDRAVSNLTRLSQLRAGEESGRLGLENLTRRLARAKLNEDNREGRFEWLPGAVRPLFLWFLTTEGRGRHFKRRFVEHFGEYALNVRWDDYADRTAAEAERSNVVAAMQLACERQDWDTVLELFAVTLNYVHTYPVWKRSVVAAEQEIGDRLMKTGRRPPLLIEINHRRENKRVARRYYEGIPEKLGAPGVTSHTDLIGLDPSGMNLPREERVILSVAAFELGVCAHSRGKYPTARSYFEAAKKLKMSFRDYGGYGIACNGVGVTLAVAGLAGKGEEGWKAKAREEFDEAWKNFEKQRNKAEEKQRWKEAEKFDKFGKVAVLNIEWLESLKG